MTGTDPTPPPHSRGYEGFGGRVGRTAADSTPSWPQTPTPHPTSPNIVVILIDDMGYSDIGPFGSEIETPTLDRLAAQGVRLTNFDFLSAVNRPRFPTGLTPRSCP
ncbi:sulfatase-like hydrolase/transferase [Rhodococcus sp. OK302]|uniref:sulfatase-like hydrolase/transferase n=1 Tax=Rhodococcus sp. OK302 TaxID=1882769 RepID=UPI000B93F8E8|nr:sulfatase-like hydrolase/transferase [Rhodococcus sp. OK302]OYD68719.1 sulfatase-like protein [Rhodococcus sp. OK302]